MKTYMRVRVTTAIVGVVLLSGIILSPTILPASTHSTLFASGVTAAEQPTSLTCGFIRHICRWCLKTTSSHLPISRHSAEGALV